MNPKYVSKLASTSGGTMVDRFDDAQKAKVTEVKRIAKLVANDVREILLSKSKIVDTSKKA